MTAWRIKRRSTENGRGQSEHGVLTNLGGWKRGGETPGRWVQGEQQPAGLAKGEKERAGSGGSSQPGTAGPPWEPVTRSLPEAEGPAPTAQCPQTRQESQGFVPGKSEQLKGRRLRSSTRESPSACLAAAKQSPLSTSRPQSFQAWVVATGR